MPAPSLVDAHRAELADVVALAQAFLLDLWGTFPLEDAEATRSLVVEGLTETVDTYGTMAAGAAADWYTEARAEAVRGRFTPRLDVPLNAEQIAANAGWSVGPLFGEAKPDLAFARVAGVAQKLVANADRATILTNTRRDPAQPRWYRGASANACAFCAMTASRGAVYRSEASGGFKAHSHCRCFPVPLWPDESHEVPSYYDDFVAGYDDAAKAVAKRGDKRTQRAVLAEMRRLTGRS